METPDRLELTLRDGTSVIARPLVPGDRSALAEAYRRLSPGARYNRFWTHTGEVVGDRMLDRVLHQDPASHVSWAILDSSRDFSPMGGASWWREAADPDEVEISFIVLDGDHGRGIGTLLLSLMWLTAFRAGVHSMVGHVLMDNRKAAGWMRACGGQGEWDGYKLSFRWKLDDLDTLPHTRTASELAHWLDLLGPEILG